MGPDGVGELDLQVQLVGDSHVLGRAGVQSGFRFVTGEGSSYRGGGHDHGVVGVQFQASLEGSQGFAEPPRIPQCRSQGGIVAGIKGPAFGRHRSKVINRLPGPAALQEDETDLGPREHPVLVQLGSDPARL